MMDRPQAAMVSPLIRVEVVVFPSDNDSLQSCVTERPYGPTLQKGPFEQEMN